MEKETLKEETIDQQISRLAQFIMDHEGILGEPSRGEGAIEVSIRLHRVLLQAIATISTLPGYTDMTPWEVMESQKKLAEV